MAVRVSGAKRLTACTSYRRVSCAKMLDHSGRSSTQVKACHPERAELAITVEIVHQRGGGRLRWILPKSEQQRAALARLHLQHQLQSLPCRFVQARCNPSEHLLAAYGGNGGGDALDSGHCR